MPYTRRGVWYKRVCTRVDLGERAKLPPPLTLLCQGIEPRVVCESWRTNRWFTFPHQPHFSTSKETDSVVCGEEMGCVWDQIDEGCLFKWTLKTNFMHGMFTNLLSRVRGGMLTIGVMLWAFKVNAVKKTLINKAFSYQSTADAWYPKPYVATMHIVIFDCRQY